MSWDGFLKIFRRRTPEADEVLSGAEKRTDWRMERRVALIGQFSSGDKVDLMGLDFGPGGLRAETALRPGHKAETTHALTQGDLLTLVVARKASSGELTEGEKVQAEAKVVWSRKAGSGYQVGLAFTGPLDSAGLARFLLDCGVAAPDGHEKRRAPRLTTEKIPGVLASSNGQITDIEVYDLAVGGALVKSRVPVKEGSTISVSVFINKNKDSLDMNGLVVRSRPGEEPQTYLLGVSFTGVTKENRARLLDFLARKLKSHPRSPH